MSPMPTTTFLRLLAADDKAAALRDAATATRAGAPAPDVYAVDPASFRQVPGSPFAYWVSEGIRRLFTKFSPFQSHGREVQHGISTKEDPRFLRLAWETPLSNHAISVVWSPFAKGGALSPYYCDIHLAIESEDRFKAIKQRLIDKYPYLMQRPDTTLDQATAWVVHPESSYFRRGLTYPSRTNGFSARAMPESCVFSSKGPAIFVSDDAPDSLLTLLAVVNSSAFYALLGLLLGRVTLAQSFEIGLVQQIPIPELNKAINKELARLACEAHDLKRDADRDDEVTHPFTVPALVRLREFGPLAEALTELSVLDMSRESRLAAIQSEIDDRCFALYGFSDEDRVQVERSEGSAPTMPASTENGDEGGEGRDADDEDDAGATVGSGNGKHAARTEVANLLMYAVGCAFGRWDARIGRDKSLAPKLADPFAPLPVCAPGALVGPDGLPATQSRIASEAWLRARPDAITLPDPVQLESATKTAISTDEYPLPVAWDGILVDDPDAPNDVVRRVRSALEYLWGERADAIETEACGILGVRDLREYLRNPRMFFDFHISRYSKSRRKAPIYWLLQSPKRNYAIWLYYHRLDADLVFKALNFHLLPKIRLAEQRLDELKAAKQQAGTTGAEARRAAQAIDRQEALLADLREFRDALDRAARHYLTPDLNDGVLLNIAPFWEVVPWKEAKAAWQQLLAGKYEWSSIGKQLREKGYVKQ